MSLGSRIQKLLNHKNLNYRSLSSFIPYSDVQIRRICLDESVPKIDFIQQLIHFFDDINPIWIVTGEGEFLKKEIFKDLNSFNKKEILDYILENRSSFLKEEPKKMDLLIDVFCTIMQRETLENLNKKVEELEASIKNKKQ